jgi:hypothetical protein
MRFWGVTLRVLKYSPDFASVTFPNGLKLARISIGSFVLLCRLTKYLHYPISKVS